MQKEKTRRTLTVTRRGTRSLDHKVPQVRLSGDWLGRAGFPPGSLLAVAVEPGRLVVTVEARPRPLHGPKKSSA
jgi:hypothetical protein